VRPEVHDWLEEIACRAGLSGLPKPGVLAAAAVCVLLLAFGAWRWLGGPQGAQPVGGTPSPAASRAAVATGGTGGTAAGGSSVATESATVTVHVVGAVRMPGVYTLHKGARAADAVQAAGGFLGDAAPAALNLARVVEDGEQVVVPTTAEVAAGAAAGSPGGGAGAAGAGAAAGGAAAVGGKVNLNTATAAQLDALPGVGPATAAKIVADRETNGQFRSPDDLMRVPGIGAKKYDALKDLVTVR
jgi:competence protein ComEA